MISKQGERTIGAWLVGITNLGTIEITEFDASARGPKLVAKFSIKPSMIKRLSRRTKNNEKVAKRGGKA